MAVVEDRARLRRHAVTRRVCAMFVFAAAGAATLAHALIAVSVTAAIDPLYADRMYDVRKWPGPATDGFKLAGTYLRERIDRSSPPITLFAGSSVTHGYPWTQRQTFASLYSRARGTVTVNAGILGLDVSGVNDWIICAARANAIHVATLIIELPVVNTISQLVNYDVAGTPVPPMSDCADTDPPREYAVWAWSRPLGIGWLVFLWDEHAYPKPDIVIRIEPVPAGYFTRTPAFNAVAGVYERQIATLLTHASTIADRVYAFPSPVFAAGLEEIGEDAGAMRAQVAATVSACGRIEGVHCLDTSFLGERRDYFMNFTHLNQAGHRKMAEWLASQVH
jgi:hypothetical protein